MSKEKPNNYQKQIMEWSVKYESLSITIIVVVPQTLSLVVTSQVELMFWLHYSSRPSLLIDLKAKIFNGEEPDTFHNVVDGRIMKAGLVVASVVPNWGKGVAYEVQYLDSCK